MDAPAASALGRATGKGDADADEILLRPATGADSGEVAEVWLAAFAATWAAVAAMHSRRQHQAVHLHDPADTLTVVARPELAVDHCPHAAIAVGRPAVRHGVDLLQDRAVDGAVCRARWSVRQIAATGGLVVVFGYAVLLHSGAYVHQYWNYWVILPVAIGCGVGADALGHALRARGTTPARSTDRGSTTSMRNSGGLRKRPGRCFRSS